MKVNETHQFHGQAQEAIFQFQESSLPALFHGKLSEVNHDSK